METTEKQNNEQFQNQISEYRKIQQTKHAEYEIKKNPIIKPLTPAPADNFKEVKKPLLITTEKLISNPQEELLNRVFFNRKSENEINTEIEAIMQNINSYESMI